MFCITQGKINCSSKFTGSMKSAHQGENEMKKLYLYILIIIILFSSSCTSVFNRLELSGEKTTQKEFNFVYEGNSAYKDLSDITFYIKSSPKERMSESGQEKWAFFMKEKTGMNFRINYCYYDFRGTGIMDIREFEKTDFSGIVYNGNVLETASLSLTDSIIDISEYINIKKYTKDVEAIVTGSSGEIWIMPAYHDFAPFYRTYDADLLEEMGIKVPTTIEEFYLFAQALKDYNHRTNENIYIASFSNTEPLDAFVDILLAYGCFVDIDTSSTGRFSSVAYNPEKMKFEYLLDNENFKKALSFIKSLYDEGLIHYFKQTDSNEVKVASYFHEEHDDDFENKCYGLYLKGPNEKNIIYCQDTVGGMSFLKNTENTEQLALFFENAVFPEKEAQLMFTYGIKGEGYYVDEDVLYINKENSFNTPGLRMEWHEGFSKTKYYDKGIIYVSSTDFENDVNEIIKNGKMDLLYRPKLYIDYIAMLSESSKTRFLNEVLEATTRVNMTISEILTIDNEVDATVDFYSDRMKNKIDLDLMNSFIK